MVMKYNEIVLHPYNPDTDETDDYPRQSSSSLFRKGSRLDKIVPRAIEHYTATRPDRPFRAISVGASYGTEIDGIAALLNAHDVQNAEIYGFDTDEKVLAMATRGLYYWYRPQFYLTRTPNKQMGELRSYGFDVTQTDSGAYVNAQAVREPHAMTFESRSLASTDNSQLPKETDLVVCSNTIPHILSTAPEDAPKITGALTAGLVPGGVLSLADDDVFFTQRNPNRDPYAAFHKGLSTVLVGEFALQPFVRNMFGYNLAFQRPPLEE